jgi:hypothetical protein|tara:strand:+ start:1578 stop:2006 length:429 start_codon:yes stop_codon:yes gene_type:complete
MKSIKLKDMKNYITKTKYENAKKIVDEYSYDYAKKLYENINHKCEIEYGDLTSKPSIIGILSSKSDMTWHNNLSKKELKQNLMQIHWILEKYGQFLYQSDATWQWMKEKEKEEKQLNDEGASLEVQAKHTDWEDEQKHLNDE